MPASTPSTHRAVAGAKGAVGGSTGTPPGGAWVRPARYPDRYRRSGSANAGPVRSGRPRRAARAGTAAAAPPTCATATGSAWAGLARAAGCWAGTGGVAVSGVGTVSSGRAAATTRSATAQALNSGWNEIGSTASLVTALMLRYSPNRSFQWNGAKQFPGRTRSVTTAGSTARPRREATSMWSPSPAPMAAASSGWSSTNGPGSSLLSRATLPVLVRVCHWCCRRPVFRTNG